MIDSLKKILSNLCKMIANNAASRLQHELIDWSWFALTCRLKSRSPQKPVVLRFDGFNNQAVAGILPTSEHFVSLIRVLLTIGGPSNGPPTIIFVPHCPAYFFPTTGASTLKLVKEQWPTLSFKCLKLSSATTPHMTRFNDASTSVSGG